MNPAPRIGTLPPKLCYLEEYELFLNNARLQIGASLSYLFVSASEFLGIFAIAEVPQ
jgi:hypothetical protein